MNQKQLLNFQKNVIMTCNELFHYLTYVASAYTALMACLVMANIKNSLLLGLFSASVFLTAETYHRARIWVRDEGKKVRIVYYMRYFPVNWEEYFQIRRKALTDFYLKTAALTGIMAVMGYYLFHRGFGWNLLFGTAKEFFCLTLFFWGPALYQLKLEKESCCQEKD